MSRQINFIYSSNYFLKHIRCHSPLIHQMPLDFCPFSITWLLLPNTHLGPLSNYSLDLLQTHFRSVCTSLQRVHHIKVHPKPITLGWTWVIPCSHQPWHWLLVGNGKWTVVSCVKDWCFVDLSIYLSSLIIRITLAAGGLCHFIVNRCSFALAEMTNASVLPGGADSETICTKNLQQTLLLFCGLLLVEKGGDKTKQNMRTHWSAKYITV